MEVPVSTERRRSRQEKGAAVKGDGKKKGSSRNVHGPRKWAPGDIKDDRNHLGFFKKKKKGMRNPLCRDKKKI